MRKLLLAYALTLLLTPANAQSILRNRFLFRCFLLMVFITSISLSASAVGYSYNFEKDGLYYKIESEENHTCTLVEGEDLYEGDIVIPETVSYNGQDYSVTKIDSYLFLYSDITSITIPSTMKSIGNYAFQGCGSLQRVNITDLSKWCQIDFGALGQPLDCAHNLYLNGELITNLVIPDNIKDIKHDTFSGCTSITSVTFPNTLESIGMGSFYCCDGLTDVKIPNSVTSIATNAFASCKGLQSISFGNGLKNMSYFILTGCKNLTTVTIGNDCAMKNLLRDNMQYKNLILSNDYAADTLSLGSTGYDLNTGETSYYLKDNKSLSNIEVNTKNKISLKGEDYCFSDEQYNNVQVSVPEENLYWYKDADVWKNFKSFNGATNINNVNTVKNGTATIYNLQGIRLKTPQHGINILNGKKFLSK